MLVTRDRAGAVIIFLVAAAAWWFSRDLPTEARLFPQIVILLMATLSIIMFAKTLKGEPRTDGEPFVKRPGNLLITVVGSVGYIFLVSQIGYFTATVLFMPGLALLLGYRNPVVIAVVTIAFLLLIWVVFVVIFKRPLPTEILFGG